MNSNLSSHDWLKVSAYLDRQLNPRDQAQLEERLQKEPELRSTLDDLRQMQAVLRSQPTLRAPRNFTLTPEMIGVRRRAPAYPALRLVTAFASLLLVVMLVGELINQRAVPASAPAQLQESMALEAPETGGVEALSQVAPETDAAGQILEIAPMAAADMPTAAAETAVELPQGTPAPSAKMVAPPSSAEDSTNAAPSENQEQAFSAPEDAAQPASDRVALEESALEIFGVGRNLWRGLEGILALIVLIAGVSWLILRWRK